MRKLFAAAVVSLVAVAAAGCALNPFAEDNIYKRKNAETSGNEMSQPTSGQTKADFQKVDADKNGVISKQEAEKVSGLAAVFDRYNPDKDGTLDRNEFTAAMESVNSTKR